MTGSEQFAVHWIVDGTIGLLIFLSLVVGVVRGFVREALSLGSWVLAVWIAYRYGAAVAGWLDTMIHNPGLSSILASVAVFVGALIVFSLISNLASHLFKKAGLGFIDRSLGALFGAFRGVAILAVLLVAARLTALNQQDWYNSSRVIPLFDPLVNRLSERMSDSLLEDVQSTVTGALDSDSSSSTD